MQFNDGWQGVCPVLGTNNTSKDPNYYNKTIDSMTTPLSINKLSGIKNVTSDEDIIIGYMKDKKGNSGFMVVNYNETHLNKKVNLNMEFNGFTKADLYQNGERTTIDLSNNNLPIKLNVGEGVFVIPHN